MKKRKSQVAAETFVSGFRSFFDWCWRNAGAFGKVLIVCLPLIAYAVGQAVAVKRGQFAIGGEVLLMILFVFIALFLVGISNRSGYGDDVPVPYERFTNDRGDGEVTVPNERVSEMILYMADVENYLERTGRL